MDSKEHLMAVLQSLIHNKQDDAKEAVRQAILMKSQSIVSDINGVAQYDSTTFGRQGNTE